MSMIELAENYFENTIGSLVSHSGTQDEASQSDPLESLEKRMHEMNKALLGLVLDAVQE